MLGSMLRSGRRLLARIPAQTKFALVVGIFFVAHANAQTVVSNFFTDVDGWHPYAGGDSNSTVSWTSTGGVGGKGGLVLTDGAEGANDYFDAPGKFLGNQSVFLGGTLSFSLEVSQLPLDNTGNPPNGGFADNVVLTANISGTTVSIAHSISPTPITSGFTFYSISLTDTSGWYLAGGLYSNTISAGEMQSVLSNLTDFRILADWHNGSENDVLGGVQFTAVPEPSTLALMLAGGGLAVLVARRSRRQR